MIRGLFLAVLLLVTGCLAQVRAADEGKPLVIGMELNYPPFEMTDTAGTPCGVGVDMGRALCTYLHRPIDIQNMPFEGLIPALKTGRIDLIISSMTATDERRKSIDFSDPYLSTGLSILVKKNSPIQNIADVDKPGNIVVVKTGTTAATYTRDHFHNATVLPLQQDTACALEVVQGKADAFLYDQISTSSQKRIPARRAAFWRRSSTNRGPSESVRATPSWKSRSTRSSPTSRHTRALTRSATSTSRRTRKRSSRWATRSTFKT
jgi:polar amino acid transport system substrate-binding protein